MPGLSQAESSLSISYVRADGLRERSDFEEVHSLAEWANLGRNGTGDHMSGYRFLVIPKGFKVKVERVTQVGGGVRYALHHLSNPSTVSFLPGGLYDEVKALVCGHISAAPESLISRTLYREFVKTVTRGFERIRAYRVGSEAAKLMDGGYRMVTISIGSPTAYDLKRD